MQMRFAAIVIAFGLAGSPQNASNARTLPKGVRSVTFGTAHRYYGPGKEMCVVAYPMPGGVFERGVAEISYAVELEPLIVKQAAARVTARSPQPLRSVPCNVFTPVRGGFSQTQLGSTISRIDKAPLESGTYTLRIEVDGQIAEVPFIIK
jgi:hypothetical protein